MSDRHHSGWRFADMRVNDARDIAAAKRKRRVVVTGSCGFIGRRVVDAFEDNGDHVWTFDRKPADGPTQHARMCLTDPQMAGIARDAPAVIVHLAAQASVAKSVDDPVTDALDNVLGTVHLLKAAQACNPQPHVIVASSAGAIPADRPRSPYGVSKLAAEHYAHIAADAGLHVTILRIANVFTHEADGAGVVQAWRSKINAEVPITVFGDGSQTRDFVHVDDVADAFVRVAEKPRWPAAYVGTGRFVDLLEVVRILEHTCGRKAQVRTAPARPWEVDHPPQREPLNLLGLGWEPRTLEDGLRPLP